MIFGVLNTETIWHQ